MSLRDKIKRYLGIAEVLEELQDNRFRVKALRERIDAIETDITKLRADLVATFNVDEMSPNRQKMSQEIGAKVRNKLIGEDKARRHTTGDL